MQHGGRIAPADPLPGEPVTLTVTVGPDLALDRVVCYYTTDGQEPQGSRGVARVGQAMPLERVTVEWHPFLWGYVERWEGSLPPQPEGTVVRYRVGGWREEEVWADWPPAQVLVERATAAFFAGKPPPEHYPLPADPSPTTFTYSVDRLVPPDWARAAVVYQIFVDRFNPGSGRPFAHPDSLGGFFGGTLAGVTEKLDYIADLGATCIWLSPIFASPTYHGYDTTDFYTVEPRLGSNEDVRRLVQAAHARGIRVLLDLVCNHVSVQHPFFQQARSDPVSPYRYWFSFDPAYSHGYRTFFNVPSMPRLNTAHPAVRDYLIQVACHWLVEYDVDGFRLDYANGPEQAFWTDFWRACKAVKPDCWCFGEIVEPPPALYHYLGRLDGCLDFHLCDLLRRALARATLDLASLERQVGRHDRFFPPTFSRPSFLDNHDMDRFLYLAGEDRRRLQLAMLILMMLPGPPIVYYGTEVGLSQSHRRGERGGLEESRLPMLWGDDRDTDLLAWHRQLIAARRTRPVIWEGRRTTRFVDATLWCYVIEGTGGPLLVAVNTGSEPRSLGVKAVAVNRLDPLVQVGPARADWEEGGLTLDLPPCGGGLWA